MGANKRTQGVDILGWKVCLFAFLAAASFSLAPGQEREGSGEGGLVFVHNYMNYVKFALVVQTKRMKQPAK